MWHEGYISEVNYTHGYYKELSPNIQELAALCAAINHPDRQDDFHALELGFGQGVSLVVNAATNPGTFWGTDFNPSHAAHARALGEACNADLSIFDDSFAELVARDDLPAFDSISLHGVWSWISEKNRALIVELAKRKLKPGGFFYIGHNITPGWSPYMPLRTLMTEFAQRRGVGSIAAKIDQALAFAHTVSEADALYFKTNPSAVERLKTLASQDRDYLAHEYFNADWHPMPFAKTADLLAEAKLEFAGSVHLLDWVDSINLSEKARELLGQIDEPVLKQTVRDFFSTQQFRRDLFVKGAVRYAGFEHRQRIRDLRLVLLTAPDMAAKKVRGDLGDAELHADVYGPVLDALATHEYQPKTVGDLLETQSCSHLSLQRMFQVAIVLCGAGICAVAHDTQTFNAVSKSTKKLNAEFFRRAQFSGDYNFIASALTGGAVAADRFEQLFLLGMASKQKDIPAWVWSLLDDQGQKLITDGVTLQTDQENLDHLNKSHRTFVEKRLPILKGLGVV